jgi:predicted lactoylglutathione lyase
MSTKIFVNLQVKDLERSIDFFTKLGYAFNPKFTDEKGTCMIISDDIFCMLIVEDFFKRFVPKDSQMWGREKGNEGIICLTARSKEKVDEWANTALSLGATENIVPEMQPPDGMMYGRSLNDLDGHIWEIMWMDQMLAQK